MNEIEKSPRYVYNGSSDPQRKKTFKFEFELTGDPAKDKESIIKRFNNLVESYFKFLK